MEVDEEALPFWFRVTDGASEAAVDSAERYVGFRLPEGLRTLLREQNGGISNYAGCEVDGGYFPMLPILGVAAERASDTLMRAFDVRAAFGVPAGVVVFSAQGSAWFGLDYRVNPANPAIVYRDGPDRAIQAVTATFGEFLETVVVEKLEAMVQLGMANRSNDEQPR